MAKYLNLGCGSRYHKDWINIDFVSNSSDVQQYDLTKGIPLEDDSCSVVYHSHVLEHFSKEGGIKFIRESYRILAPEGIIRVVVPDLEQLARQYLQSLTNVMAEKSDLSKADYQWSVIELFDQMVREKPGGEMLKYWSQEHLINEAHIVERVGDEFSSWRKSFVTERKEASPSSVVRDSFYAERIRKYLLNKLGANSDNLAVGNFRNGGEIHKWMYDRYSLSELLSEVGFKDIQIKSAFESNVPLWNKYSWLDVENGKVRKPDSIFIEARK